MSAKTDRVNDARDAARYRWLRDMQCNHLYVTRNSDHAPNYLSASEWIDEDSQGEFSDVSAEELQRMKDSNTIWCIQVYPHTPIGFWFTHGSTLDAAIDAAMTDVSELKS